MTAQDGRIWEHRLMPAMRLFWWVGVVVVGNVLHDNGLGLFLFVDVPCGFDPVLTSLTALGCVQCPRLDGMVLAVA